MFVFGHWKQPNICIWLNSKKDFSVCLHLRFVFIPRRVECLCYQAAGFEQITGSLVKRKAFNRCCCQCIEDTPSHLSCLLHRPSPDTCRPNTQTAALGLKWFGSQAKRSYRARCAVVQCSCDTADQLSAWFRQMRHARQAIEAFLSLVDVDLLQFDMFDAGTLHSAVECSQSCTCTLSYLLPTSFLDRGS